MLDSFINGFLNLFEERSKSSNEIPSILIIGRVGSGRTTLIGNLLAINSSKFTIYETTYSDEFNDQYTLKIKPYLNNINVILYLVSWNPQIGEEELHFINMIQRNFNKPTYLVITHADLINEKYNEKNMMTRGISDQINGNNVFLTGRNPTAETKELLYRIFNHFPNTKEYQAALSLPSKETKVRKNKSDEKNNLTTVEINQTTTTLSKLEKQKLTSQHQLREGALENQASTSHENASNKISLHNNNFPLLETQLTQEEKIVALSKNGKFLWHNKGGVLYFQCKFNEAIACFDKATELDKNYTAAWYSKGNALYFQGKYNEAIACYDKVIELDKNYIHAWNSKGTALRFQGNYNEAIACCDKAIELDKNYVYAWYNKSLSYLMLKDLTQAQKYLAQADTINTQESFVKMMLKMSRGLYEFAINNTAKSDECLKPIETHYQQTADLFKIHEQCIICVNITKFFIHYGALREAREYLEKSLRIQPEIVQLISLESELQLAEKKGVEDRWNKQAEELAKLQLEMRKLAADKKLLEDQNQALANTNLALLETEEKLLLSIEESIVPALRSATNENTGLKKTNHELLTGLEVTHKEYQQREKEQQNQNHHQKLVITRLLKEKEEWQSTFDKEKIVKENKQAKEDNKRIRLQQMELHDTHERLKKDHAKTVQEKSELFNEVHHLSNVNKNKEQENKTLTKELNSAERAKEDLLKKVEKLETENTKLKKENKTLKQKTQELEKTIKEQKKSIESLEMKDYDKQARINKLEERLVKMESESSDDALMDKMSRLMSKYGKFRDHSQTSTSTSISSPTSSMPSNSTTTFQNT